MSEAFNSCGPASGDNNVAFVTICIFRQSRVRDMAIGYEWLLLSTFSSEKLLSWPQRRDIIIM